METKTVQTQPKPSSGRRYKYANEEEAKEANRRKARERYAQKKEEILAQQKARYQKNREILLWYQQMMAQQSHQ